jgi:folate-dependent tRNA-U54 methylase TrmFO/GidA
MIPIHIIGGGLAGSAVAWQVAREHRPSGHSLNAPKTRAEPARRAGR